MLAMYVGTFLAALSWRPLNPLVWGLGRPMWLLADCALLWCVMLPLLHLGARLVVWQAARRAPRQDANG